MLTEQERDELARVLRISPERAQYLEAGAWWVVAFAALGLGCWFSGVVYLLWLLVHNLSRLL